MTNANSNSNSVRFINDDVKLRYGGSTVPKLSVEELKKTMWDVFVRRGYNKKEYTLHEFQKLYDIGNELLCWLFLSRDDDNIYKDVRYLTLDPYEIIYEDDNPNSTGAPLIGFHTLPNGFTFFGFVTHDQVCERVFMIFYWDGKKFSLYTPSYGNTVNLDCQCVVGEEQEVVGRGQVNEDALIKKYRKMGFWKDSKEKKYGVFCDDEYGLADAYLAKYGLTYKTAGFNWDAIKEDIMARIELTK